MPGKPWDRKTNRILWNKKENFFDCEHKCVKLEERLKVIVDCTQQSWINIVIPSWWRRPEAQRIPPWIWCVEQTPETFNIILTGTSITTHSFTVVKTSKIITQVFFFFFVFHSHHPQWNSIVPIKKWNFSYADKHTLLNNSNKDFANQHSAEPVNTCRLVPLSEGTLCRKNVMLFWQRVHFGCEYTGAVSLVW